MVKEKYEDYLKFIDESLRLAKSIPKYFSKFSNKIYCNHQKLAIYVLMQKLKLTYRGIVSWLKSNELARLHLGLRKVPVHTTMVRFGKRIAKIIHLALNLDKANTVAVDATGFELESKSYYYRNVWNSRKKQKTRQYMKLSIAIDTDRQIIMNYKIRKKTRNDTIDFITLVKNLDTKCVIADKGYDSWKNRNFVLRKLKAIPIIPVRNYSKFYGYYKHGKRIDGRNYHQRSKVETVFSVIKRRYGSILRARSFAMQKVEIIGKIIAYNLDRKINAFLLFFKGLHQSPVTKSRCEKCTKSGLNG